MFELKQQPVEEIKNDYTLFFPTSNQMKILEDMSRRVSDLTQIDQKFLELIYIKVIIQRQMKLRQFHYEVEESLPQARITSTMKNIELIRKTFLDLLVDTTQIDHLMECHSEVMDYYVDKYAMREPGEEL